MFSLSGNALRRSCVKFFHFVNPQQKIHISIAIGKSPLTAASMAAAAAGGTTATVNQRNYADYKKTADTAEQKQQQQENMENKTEAVRANKEELKKRLTPLQYQVTQEAATERPFTGCYNKHYEKGVYQCIVCHQDLFSSDTKYDSGCGWPAFNDVLDKGKVTLHRDASIPERIRTEVRCAQCSAHMGHVFEDGPKPTRKRYCINSAAIEFLSADELNGKTTAATPAATPIAQQ